MKYTVVTCTPSKVGLGTFKIEQIEASGIDAIRNAYQQPRMTPAEVEVWKANQKKYLKSGR